MTKPRVKQLEWEDWDGGMTAAATPWGKYHLNSDLSWGKYNLNSDLRLSLPTGAYRRYETEQSAKAAAQADYEARILSALDLTPDPAVQALVEARAAWEAFKGAAVSADYFDAVERLNAALAAFDKTKPQTQGD